MPFLPVLLPMLQAGFIFTDTTPGDVDSAVFSLVKIIILIAFGLYVAFAFVVTRQIAVMKKTLITPVSPFITTVGFVHLIFTVIVFVLALVGLE